MVKVTLQKRKISVLVHSFVLDYVGKIISPQISQPLAIHLGQRAFMKLSSF
jgi:hypothetical protein